MNEPPNSRYFAANLQRPAHRVDDAVERLLDLPDLLHAELPLLRVLGADARSGGSPRRSGGPAVPSASTVALAIRSEPGSKFDSSSPSRPRPLSPERTPTHRAVLDEQLVAGGLPEDVDARLLGLLRRASGRAARPRSRGCRGCGTAAGRAAAGSRACGSAAGRPCPSSTGAVGGPVLLVQVREQRSASPTGSSSPPTAGASRAPLPFSTSATGTSPSDSSERLVLGEQLHQPDRAREAGRAAADDRDAHLDPLVLGIGRARRRTPCAESTGGGNSIGAVAMRPSPSWPSRPR